MKRQMVLGLALAMALASSVDAQIGGLIRKKAGEVVGGKKTAPTPTATPTPAPEPTTTAPATAKPEGTTPSPAPAPAGAATPARSTSKAAVSPLETSELPVQGSAIQVVRGRINTRSNGDWDRLPHIPAAAVAAAYGLGDAAQVALVETVGAALKTLVMSPAFMAEHDKFIKDEHQGVDHGLKNVVTVEDAVKRNDFKAIEALQARQMAAMALDQVRAYPADMLKNEFTQELAKWKADAANPKNSERAKYQKIVAVAKPIESLPGNDEKFVRGYAVMKSIDFGGPDNEAALFALHERIRQEKEQAAYDSHNLKTQLKQQLTTFVAVASKVNFKAPTVEKQGKTVFVNAADERQGAIWKACFRAGEGPTAAALKFARAWLAEL